MGGFAIRDADEKVFDLGEVILLPGLVNAHCHLDYTDMAGELPPPKTFTDWIPLITAAKTGLELFRIRALLAARRAHALENRHHHRRRHRGHAGSAAGSLGCHATAGLFISGNDRHPRPTRPEARFCAKPSRKIDSLTHARCSASLSPHAPYSTLPELLRLTAGIARKRKWRLTTHVAESAEEFEMFTHARGKMFDWLEAQRTR